MPKKQPTTAKKARSIQRATGQRYTTALRSARHADPARRLADALRAAGLDSTGGVLGLDACLDADDEFHALQEPLVAAYRRAWDALDSAPAGTSRRDLKRLEYALDEATAAIPHLDDDPWESDQVRVYWAFIALRHVGAGHADRQLAEAAAAVLTGFARNSDVTADAIRRCWLTDATSVELTGPDTGAAAAARDAARTLASACATPTGCDEHWLACAKLVRRAAELAGAAAR